MIIHILHMKLSNNQNGWASAKVRIVFHEQISQFVGIDKEILNINQFINEAVKEKIEREKEIQKQ